MVDRDVAASAIAARNARNARTPSSARTRPHGDLHPRRGTIRIAIKLDASAINHVRTLLSPLHAAKDFGHLACLWRDLEKRGLEFGDTSSPEEKVAGPCHKIGVSPSRFCSADHAAAGSELARYGFIRAPSVHRAAREPRGASARAQDSHLHCNGGLITRQCSRQCSSRWPG